MTKKYQGKHLINKRLHSLNDGWRLLEFTPV